MKFKFVQTRQVRYSVVIEAPNMDMADDFVHLHEEWQEERTEECDPPWREECPEDAQPDVYILGGRVLAASEYLRPPKSIPDHEGVQVKVGAKIEYQHGGPAWMPGTVAFLLSDYYDTYALIGDLWVPSSRLRAVEG